MDNYATGGIGASLVIVLGIAYKIFNTINHHRLRSECCNLRFSASIDVEETTPKSSSSVEKKEQPKEDV
jgi:hypothetical protein